MATPVEVDEMDIPLQISFRNMDPSDAIKERVRERTEKLETVFGHITSCRVMIEAPDRHHRKGKLYHVRIDIGVPGKELLVNRHPRDKHEHEDVYVAIRDAFDAARRQLEDYGRKLAGQVKTHEGPPSGTVVRLFAYEGYGFIATADGREVYFHKNSVLDDAFDKIDVGSEVRVTVAEGESPNGPQATTVRLVGKVGAD